MLITNNRTGRIVGVFKTMSLASIFVVSLLGIGCAEHQQMMMNRMYYTEINRAYSPDEVSFINGMTILLVNRQARFEGKFLKVALEFINTFDDTVTNTAYKIEWLDDQGFVVDSTAWKPLTISGNEKVQVTEMAIKTNVTRCRLVISSK
ncbi:MAG: DUF1425 domain-containing protein [Nitrospirae bacterium]|nr:DUF1425 domain-containing protein [Nitrospirota bacterium]